MSFDQALKFVLEREGGYVNDSSDPGGETKFGISKKAYPNLDIRNLTPELAGAIYKADYWGPSGCEHPLAPAGLLSGLGANEARARQVLGGLAQAGHFATASHPHDDLGQNAILTSPRRRPTVEPDPQPGASVFLKELLKIAAAGLAAAFVQVANLVQSGSPVTGKVVVSILVGTVLVRIAMFLVSYLGPKPA